MNEYQRQRAYELLTPAEKAKITRNFNKLWNQYEEAYASEYVDFRAALDTYAPARDAKIAEAEKRYEEIVAQAAAEFAEAKKDAMAIFNKAIESEHQALESARDAAFKRFREAQAKFEDEVLATKSV